MITIPDHFIKLSREAFEQLTNEASKDGRYDVFRLELDDCIYNYIYDGSSSSWCFFGNLWTLLDASYIYLKKDHEWIFFNKAEIPMLTIYDTYEEFLQSLEKLDPSLDEFNPFVIK